MKWISATLVLFATWPAFAGAAPVRAKVLPVGPAFESPIVDVFAPPTRSDNPYAATHASVYVFKSDLSTWSEVFRVPDTKTRILDIEGYEKSSEPLYVAHTGGISITHDAGLNWARNTPRGYMPEIDGWGGLAVHPADRKQAVAATRHRAWQTVDFGEHWTALPLPRECHSIAGVAYSRLDPAHLFVWDDSRLYSTDSEGREWTVLAPGGGRLTAVAISPQSVDAIVSGADTTVWRVESTDPGTGSHTRVSLDGTAVDAAGDIGNGQNVWIATSAALSYWVRRGDALEPFSSVSGSYQRVYPHPRVRGTAYTTERNQLERIELPGFSEQQTVDDSRSGPLNVSMESGELPPDENAQAMSDALLTERVMQSQPPLRQAVAAALDFANYDPDEVRNWRKNARRRNALPELRLRAGTRDYPTDVFETANPGTPVVNDIHLSDRVRDLDYAEVEVRWDLSDLLFDREQPDVSREARNRAADRNDLIRDISTLYYDRIAILVQLVRAADSMDADTKLAKTLDLRRTTDLLNELCGQQMFTPDVP